MMSLSKSSCDKMTRCSLRKTVFRLLYELLDTSKTCAVIIAAGSNPGVFQEGDLVLWLIQDQTDAHKLSPPWEGPFVVSKNLHNGSYYLIDIREHKDSRRSEEETRRPWNIAQLRPYYT